MSYSNSKLQQFRDCPLSYFYKYELGLEKLEDEVNEHHLRFGHAGHKALEALYLGDSVESAQKVFEKEYPQQLDPNDKAKTIENGKVALTKYAEHWKDEDKKWKVLEVERRGELEDGFAVKLDLVFENKDFGGVYGVDHKFVGGKRAYLSGDYWSEFEPNSQITTYYPYIQEKFGDCSGFYINAIGMGFRERMYKGEPAGFWCRFQRMMFSRNTSQVAQEKANQAYWVGCIENSKATDIWGFNTHSCKFCSYKSICQAGYTWPEDKELITISYKQRPLEPKGESDANQSGILPAKT